MKQLFLLSLIAAFTFSSASSQVYLSGKSFSFPKGQKEWSNPVHKDLGSVKMDNKKIPYVPLEFRIKLVKKVGIACHYEVEVKNISTTQGISFAAYNDYTSASGNTILHKVKVKPGQTATFKIIYSSLRCKVKSEDDCEDCSWTFRFQDIKAF